MHEVSSESLKLIKNMTDISVDLKKKLHALEYLTKPLSDAGHEIETESRKIRKYDLTSEITECLAAGWVIYNKIKEGIRAYGKNR